MILINAKLVTNPMYLKFTITLMGGRLTHTERMAKNTIKMIVSVKKTMRKLISITSERL